LFKVCFNQRTQIDQLISVERDSFPSKTDVFITSVDLDSDQFPPEHERGSISPWLRKDCLSPLFLELPFNPADFRWANE